ITLLANQALVGDVAHLGLGATSTTISGQGPSACGEPGATIEIPSTSSGASIRGFNIVTSTTISSIVVCGGAATIASNTIEGAPEIGVVAISGASVTLTSNNITAEAGGVGLYVVGTSTAVVARGNSI